MQKSNVSAKKPAAEKKNKNISFLPSEIAKAFLAMKFKNDDDKFGWLANVISDYGALRRDNERERCIKAMKKHEPTECRSADEFIRIIKRGLPEK